MKVQVFLEQKEVVSESNLREVLNYRKDGKYGAFWLVEDMPILALFINGEYSCLYYRPGSEEDKWSKNTTFYGDENDTIDFLIENYQCDDLPKEFVIPIKDGLEAFIYYYKSQSLSNKICWC